VVVMVVSVVGVAWGMPPQCSPEMLEEIDNPKIREICHFLQTYVEAVDSQGYAKGEKKKDSS
jgi:hypothetical protein